MGRTHRALIAIGLVVVGVSLVAQQNAPVPPVPHGLPDWAYTPPPPPGSPPPPSSLPADDTAVVRIPGTARTHTRGQLRGLVEIPDWYPDEHHGPMPEVVRVTRDGVRACGFCHLADGQGRPENASVNGLPVAYFIQQMEDFKNGLRDSADPRKNNTNMMIGFSKMATAEEVKAAADYFAAQPYLKRIKVIESRTAPKVRLQGGMHMAIEGDGAGLEPLGDQIVEVPDNPLRAEARDTTMGYTAYVPVGSIKKGKALAAKYQCAVCHGSNLEGLGPVPPLAGRSPSYAMRQLLDMKLGARRGPWSAMMKPVVDTMSMAEMLTVSAYAASLTPPAAPRTGVGTR